MRKLPPSFLALPPLRPPSFSVAHLQSIREYSCPCIRGGGRGESEGPGRVCRGDAEKGVRERREPRYLTDNVIIVSQCTGMRDVRRGVAQFPYIWVGALSDGGQREIIIVLLRCRPVLTAGCRKMEGKGGRGVRERMGWGEEKRVLGKKSRRRGEVGCKGIRGFGRYGEQKVEKDEGVKRWECKVREE